MNLESEIKKFFKGEIHSDKETLKKYSKDAGLLEVYPSLVVYPKDSEDLKSLVRWISENKAENPELSLSIRAGGSCMSGGSLNESIIADVTHHLNKIGKLSRGALDNMISAWVEPGAFYKDFETETLKHDAILPCFPASKNLCALGGMIGNNCAGEKTLRYGKMENFIEESKYIFSDGNEYMVKPLTRSNLIEKMGQDNFEGNLYKRIHNLIENNQQIIQSSKPNVSKNSAGYYLWNVWHDDKFDLNRLLVGAQGTLGILTEARVRLIPVEPVSKLFVIFLPNTEKLAELINIILPTNPESLESYDDATLKLAFRFFPDMLRILKPKNFLKLMISFIPEGFMVLRSGFPRIVLLVEYAGTDEKEVDNKLNLLEEKLKLFNFPMRKTRSQEESDKYWTIRRESFNLLRQHVRGKRTAPFVDDVVVRPEDMPEFLPKMKAILDKYKLTYTIAGHAGNGNFHIIPLMDMRDKRNVKVIEEVGEKVYNLVSEYKGSITGEHNDGLIRTPYLNKMYSDEMLKLFEEVKNIFDPQNIFNPHKKVGCTVEYMASHIAVEP